MIKEKHLTTTIDAPYVTLNMKGAHTKRIWMVFHGYGMLARYFVRKFEVLDSTNFVIAPQGLSKYYLEGFTGRVGASWMTKEDRLTEISNQQKFLNAIVSRELGDAEGLPLVILGFSQGAATASRFAAFSGIHFSKLILWSGMFPEDLRQEEVAHWPDEVTIEYFTGNHDPFLKPGLKETQRQLVQEIAGRDVIVQEFDGGHEIVPDLLLKI